MSAWLLYRAAAGGGRTKNKPEAGLMSESFLVCHFLFSVSFLDCSYSYELEKKAFKS